MLTQRNLRCEIKSLRGKGMTRLSKCIECGSTKLVRRKKNFTFETKNPGFLRVRQKCLECSNCGESYFNDEEVNQLSKKIMKKLK